MKPVRLMILGVAVVAAGLAGIMAMNLASRPKIVQQVQSVVEKEPNINVLVAASNLPIGARVTEQAVHWMPWPQGSVVAGMVTQEQRPNAIQDLTGAVIRLPVFQGEPIRAEKVADSSNRVLSSLLPAGKRAVATEISVATGAGGFILPNDRVDVIMVRKNPATGKFLSETALSNVRVLAIDQQIQEKEDGTKTAVGTTATLELTPDQTKVLVVVQQMADRLSLALRSVADAQEQDTTSADYLLTGTNGSALIQVIKSGTITTDGPTTPPKVE